jgi:hypothetical protein
MPLYPCLALLLGLVIERGALSTIGTPLRRAWEGYLATVIFLMLIIAVLVVGACFLGYPAMALLSQPPRFALLYAAVAASVGVLVWSSRQCTSSLRAQASVLGLACFLGLSCTGLYLNAVNRKSEDAAPAVARVKDILPQQEHLVSLGPVHHLFAYHYRTPIPLRPWPQRASESLADVDYFCLTRYANEPVTLPFPWEEIAVISCDRYRMSPPQCQVVVGRRLHGAVARILTQDSSSGNSEPAQGN